MRLPATTPFLADANARQICALLEQAGHKVYFVGGCVRNAVLGAPASDVDMSTDARPEQVMDLAEQAGLRAVPTGVAHGTVTLVMDDTAFEITTFRRDVATDGRRAVVAFSDRIEEDAVRRDFTMNALYAKPDGTIVDPLGGLPDARAGRVVFIEDARDRLREDYLRLLRFFRFWAYYADHDQGFDPETLAALSESLEGLAHLSKERIGSEILKLLSAPEPSQAVATMAQIGVFAHVLPVASVEVLPRLVALEQATETAPDPLRRLACLGPDAASERLRLSKSDTRDLSVLRAAIGDSYGPKALGQEYGASRGWDIVLLRAASLEQAIDDTAKDLVVAGAQAEFPVKAADIAHRLSGRDLGQELARLRGLWLASDLTLTRDALLG